MVDERDSDMTHHPDIEITDDGVIVEREVRPVDLANFAAVEATSTSVGFLIAPDDTRFYFIEFHNPTITEPLRIVLSQQLTESLVTTLIETVES